MIEHGFCTVDTMTLNPFMTIVHKQEINFASNYDEELILHNVSINKVFCEIEKWLFYRRIIDIKRLIGSNKISIQQDKTLTTLKKSKNQLKYCATFLHADKI